MTTPNINLDPQYVTEQVNQVISESGLPPDFLVQAGELAEAAIMDRSGRAYKQFVKFMVERGLETEKSLKKPDYQMLGMLVAMGKVAQRQIGPTA